MKKKVVQFYNPTGYLIEGKAYGEPYTFEPFTEETVWDSTHWKFLTQKYAYKGLVMLDYEDAMNREAYKKFPEPSREDEREELIKKLKADDSFKEKFKKDQSLRGLKNLYDYISSLYSSELTIEADIQKDKRKAQAEILMLKSEKFSNQLEEIKGWISELEKKDSKKNK